MKKIVLGSVLAMSALASLQAQAQAVTFCSAANVAGNGASVSGGGSTSFIKVGFRPKCSANVWLLGQTLNALTFRVGSASSKGKSSYNGSSFGGSVARYSDCPVAAPCGANAASDALIHAASS